MSAEYQSNPVIASESIGELRRFVTRELESPVEKSGDFESFERELRHRMQALEAEIVRERLARYDMTADEIEIAGDRFRRKGRFKKEYHGLSGSFEVERSLYVPCGSGGRSIVPLEIRAGIIEGAWTPLLARVMARTVASTTPKEAAEIFEEFGGAVPSTSSLDRLPKRLSERWEMKREEFEIDLRESETVPSEAASVAVSLDGVHVPMKDGDRTAKRSQEGKRPKGPAGFREVGCGTLTLFDEDGKRLETVRYAQMPEAKKKTLKSQLEAELASILSVRPDLRVVGLADGAGDNWDFLSALPERLGIEEYYEADDIFHVLQHVKVALDAYHGEGSPESKSAFEETRIWLREASDGAERVIRALRYRRDRSSGSKRKTIVAKVKFLQKRKERLRYKELLDRGLPIGSGVVEAACKTLAAQRMKRSGMSWLRDGGQAILTLRSLLQSNRWERSWPMIAAEYRLPANAIRVAA